MRTLHVFMWGGSAVACAFFLACGIEMIGKGIGIGIESGLKAIAAAIEKRAGKTGQYWE
jgi:hypothetical protein